MRSYVSNSIASIRSLFKRRKAVVPVSLKVSRNPYLNHCLNIPMKSHNGGRQKSNPTVISATKSVTTLCPIPILGKKLHFESPLKNLIFMMIIPICAHIVSSNPRWVSIRQIGHICLNRALNLVNGIVPAISIGLRRKGLIPNSSFIVCSAALFMSRKSIDPFIPY